MFEYFIRHLYIEVIHSAWHYHKQEYLLRHWSPLRKLLIKHTASSKMEESVRNRNGYIGPVWLQKSCAQSWLYFFLLDPDGSQTAECLHHSSVGYEIILHKTKQTKQILKEYVLFVLVRKQFHVYARFHSNCFPVVLAVTLHLQELHFVLFQCVVVFFSNFFETHVHQGLKLIGSTENCLQ